ncbi:MAG: kua-ubiquitin conjugating enzyme hybrid localization domain protein [Acidobacteria bacterium]|nr:kua-ubiquitin conjugating enzyme hybrid localization domain protein [Acidobacteriota bacterium]
MTVLVEVFFTAAFFVCFVLLILRLVSIPLHTIHWLLIALAALLGYLLADFVSGWMHWFCDTFFEEDTLFIGPLIIAPFRDHHRNPLGMTHHGFLELNGNTCLALTPVMAGFLWMDIYRWPEAFSIFLTATMLFFTASVFGTNLFHRAAHEPSPLFFVRTLQNLGVILSPGKHHLHHEAPYRKSYCVTSGWLNPVLDGIGFFPICERVLIAIGFPRTSR